MQDHFLRIAGYVFVVGMLIAIAPTAEAQTGTRCFNDQSDPNKNSDIIYCIAGPIRQYWEGHGGLAVFGYPIGPQREALVEGTWQGQVQWFERDRLEDHGAEGVLAGRLGARYLELQSRPWQSFPAVNGPPSGCEYFSVTRHSMCEPFRSYWLTRGDLLRFGYPITEPFSEQLEDGQTYIVQYFERRRLEWHALAPNPNDLVMLGRLGSAVCEIECDVRCPRTGCR